MLARLKLQGAATQKRYRKEMTGNFLPHSFETIEIVVCPVTFSAEALAILGEIALTFPINFLDLPVERETLSSQPSGSAAMLT